MNIELFNFEEDWNLVLPYLNDPEVLDALDESMYEFSLYHGWSDMPVWDRSNGRGPWEYTRSDYWAEKATVKLNELPELQDIHKNYERLSIEAGLDPEEMFYEHDDPEVAEI